MASRRFLEERADFPLQPLLGACCRLGRKAKARGALTGRGRNLHVPAWRDGAHQAREAAEAGMVLETVEHFEDGQVCLASGEPLGTAAARDAYGIASPGQLCEKDFDKGGLADAGFTRDRHDATCSLPHLIELCEEHLDLGLAADDRERALRLRRSGARSDRWRRKSRG